MVFDSTSNDYYINNNHTVLFGIFGTNPFGIHNFLIDNNISHDIYYDFSNFKNDLNEGDVAIISLFNRSGNNNNQVNIDGMSIHTYALKKDSNNIVKTYNKGGIRTSYGSFDLNELISSDEHFMVGYILH